MSFQHSHEKQFVLSGFAGGGATFGVQGRALGEKPTGDTFLGRPACSPGTVWFLLDVGMIACRYLIVFN